MKFNEYLDENAYSIPRLANGYKGDIVPVFRVPQLRSEASIAAAARRQSGSSLASSGSSGSGVTDTKMTTSTMGNGIASTNNTTHPSGMSSNHSSAYSLAEPMEVSPIAAKNNTSIAAIWAATHDFDDAESDGIAATTPTPIKGHSNSTGRASPAASPSPPPLHPASTSAAVTGPGAAAVEQHQPTAALARRPSDNESVMSDITTATNNQPKAGRRGSLLAGLGLGMGTRRPSNGSADGNNTTDSHQPIHRKISRKSVLITTSSAGYNGGAIQVLYHTILYILFLFFLYDFILSFILILCIHTSLYLSLT